MRKIPTMFKRDRRSGLVTEEVTPGCEWVLDGEGAPTRKYDGTCVLLDADGSWWARRQVKPGRPEPAGFWPVETDEATGKTFGWEPAEQSPFWRHLGHALVEDGLRRPRAGTYELCGPAINGNPEGLDGYRLLPHARAEALDVADRSFWALRLLMLGRLVADCPRVRGADGVEHVLEAEPRREDPFPHEGIVFHHPDGRMAKIKRKDFISDNR